MISYIYDKRKLKKIKSKYFLTYLIVNKACSYLGLLFEIGRKRSNPTS